MPWVNNKKIPLHNMQIRRVRWKGHESSVVYAGKVSNVRLCMLERSQKFSCVCWKGLEGSVVYAGKVLKVRLCMLERSRKFGCVCWKGL